MPSRPPVHKPHATPGPAKHAYDNKRESAAKRGYGHTWRKHTRTRILVRDLYQCQSCKATVVGKDAHVDHIIPKSKGGTDHDDNLQCLCIRCHSEKTAREDGGFGRG